MCNIISIKDKKKVESETEVMKIEKEEEFSFEEQMKKNKEIKDKMAKERSGENKKVLRNYRIKN